MGLLILDQLQEEIRQDHPLQRVLRGEPVALRVTDPDKATKSRFKNPTLFMIPIDGEGKDGGRAVLFALDGHGARVLDISNIKMADLFMVGLSATAAKIMVREFNDLYAGDGKDGSEDTTHRKDRDEDPARPKRRRRRPRRKRTDQEGS